VDYLNESSSDCGCETTDSCLHNVCSEEMRNAFKILIRKPYGKITLGRWEGN
jgi:hypothetical protein